MLWDGCRGGGGTGGRVISAGCGNDISFQTDGIHSNDNVRVGNRNPGTWHLTHTPHHTPNHTTHTSLSYCANVSSALSTETLSEAVKVLKAEYLVKAIKALKMDQAIVFCRTKVDCDNIEAFLLSLGGGICSLASHITSL